MRYGDAAESSATLDEEPRRKKGRLRPLLEAVAQEAVLVEAQEGLLAEAVARAARQAQLVEAARRVSELTQGLQRPSEVALRVAADAFLAECGVGPPWMSRLGRRHQGLVSAVQERTRRFDERPGTAHACPRCGALRNIPHDAPDTGPQHCRFCKCCLRTATWHRL